MFLLQIMSRSIRAENWRRNICNRKALGDSQFQTFLAKFSKALFETPKTNIDYLNQILNCLQRKDVNSPLWDLFCISRPSAKGWNPARQRRQHNRCHRFQWVPEHWRGAGSHRGWFPHSSAPFILLDQKLIGAELEPGLRWAVFINGFS